MSAAEFTDIEPDVCDRCGEYAEVFQVFPDDHPKWDSLYFCKKCCQEVGNV
jgi:hypothetical protein